MITKWSIIIFACYNFLLQAQVRGIQFISDVDNRYDLIAPHDTKQLILNKPGNYRFSKGINADFTESGTIIHITSNNITLNLQNKTVTQKNSNSSNINLTGIYIADGVSNVSISNSNFNNITGTAIIIGQNCFNITINNIMIAQAKSGGIEIQDGADTIFINNCFSGKSLSSGKDNIGLSLTSNKNVNVSQCSFIGNRAPTGYNAFGIKATNCIDCTISNCTINGNSGDKTSGIYLYNSHGFTLESNESKGNISNVTVASGLDLENSNGNYISQLIVTQNLGHTNVYGIRLCGSSNYNQINNSSCTFQKVNSTGNAYGIYIETGLGNLLKHLSILSNTGGTSNSSESCGIRLINTIGTTIKNSRLNYNNGKTGIGYGLYMTDTDQSIISENEFYYNHGTSTSFGIKEEEDIESNTHNLFFSNIAFGNKTNYSFTYLTLNSIQNTSYTSPRTISKETLGNVSITG